MSRREQDEQPCGCVIDLRTGTVSTCEQCSRVDVPVQAASRRNLERARRVIS